jgi:drug/metabolite transporter (DMT)-like permease
MRDTLKPYAFVIAGVLLGGLSPVFTKLLLLENLSQSTVVAARYLLAIALLAPLGVPHRRPENAPPPDRRAWITLFLVGAFGSGLGALLFTAAVDLASAGVVNSISKTAPIFVALFVYFTLREQVSYLRFLLVAVMVAAVVLIGAGELTFSRQLISARLLGDGLALAAGMTRAVAEILGKSALRRFTPATVAFWRFGVGFLVTGVVCASTGGYLGLPVLALRGWLILLALAGVSTSLAMALYYRGLASIPAHVAVSLKLLGVIVTVVVSWIVLGEGLTPYHVAGIAVLISGAYLLVLRAARAPADLAGLRVSARRPLGRVRPRVMGLVVIIVTGSVGSNSRSSSPSAKWRRSSSSSAASSSAPHGRATSSTSTAWSGIASRGSCTRWRLSTSPPLTPEAISAPSRSPGTFAWWMTAAGRTRAATSPRWRVCSRRWPRALPRAGMASSPRRRSWCTGAGRWAP